MADTFKAGLGRTLGFACVAAPLIVGLQFFGLPTDLLTISMVAFFGASSGS